MSNRMPEHADILNGLYGLRTSAPGWADLLAALGLGLLIAGLTGTISGAFRRPRHAETTIATKLAQAMALPRAERVLALASILRGLTERHAPGTAPWTERASAHFNIDPVLLRDLSRALYRPDATLDTEPIERVLARYGE